MSYANNYDIIQPKKGDFEYMKIATTTQTIEEIKSIIAQNPEEGNDVRIYVAGMGCSGPAFGLALDTRNNEDIVYEEGGQVFIMEPNFFEQFGDFKVEYTQRGYLVEPVNKDVLGPSDCGTCSGCN